MNRTKNIIIGALLVAIMAMSIGYAALAQRLDINATANIDASWQVEFTEISNTEAIGAELKGIPAATGTSATFEVDLAYPGATATFDITVENKGSIDAYLASITGLEAANEANPAELQYAVTGIATGDDLDAKATKTFQVTVTWVSQEVDTIPETTTKTATITLNYKQKTA